MAGARQQARPQASVAPQALQLPPTTFVGREKETAEIARRLTTGPARLVTLTGPGGVGKTRLALEVAAGLGRHFQDGVVRVSLSTISDPELVPSAIAVALGLPEKSGQSRLDALKEALHARAHLLVLDNFEQVVSAAPQLVELVSACPELRILVTSREVLRVSGEHEFALAPLGVPEPADAERSLDALARVEAVQLFVERARAVKSDFALSDHNARAIADICRRLDGLPLAIELAAAWTRVLAPAALLGRLEHRLPLLIVGVRDLPARHQTLRGAIAWSYELLAADERALLRELAVFSGGYTTEAVERVCRPGPALLLLARLVEKSLVRQESVGEETRFGMLETTREFALEQLEASRAADTLRRRHAAYYADLAEAAQPELVGPAQAEWLRHLELEHANFRAALDWTLSSNDAEPGLRLAAALSTFWEARGHLAEGQRWLERALASGEMASPRLRASALHGAGLIAVRQAEYARATDLLEQALALRRVHADRAEVAVSLVGLGSIATYQGDYARARALYEESLALRRASGEPMDPRSMAIVLHCLGTVAATEGDYARARPLLEESLTLRRRVDDAAGTALTMDNLGVVLSQLGEHARADAVLEGGLDLRRKLGHKWGIASSLLNLSWSALDQGHVERAAMLCRQSLQLHWEIGDKVWLAGSLEQLAGTLVQQAQAEHAARLLGAAAALREHLGQPLSPIEVPRVERYMAAASAQLDPNAFATHWARGQAMSLEETVQAALGSEELASPAAAQGPPPARSDAASPLTPREREVAGLIARGLSNRQIADTLVISEATATVHVKHILAKLEFVSRAQVAAWAVSCGLLKPVAASD